MGVYTNIDFFNGNDPKFLAARNGSPIDREEWEEAHGSIEDRPGAEIEDVGDIIIETDDEYGGWIIPVKDIPKNATHIVVHRG